MERQTHICDNLSKLNDIAFRLLNKYPNNRVFAFDAAMGVGKTTFISKICKALNAKNIACSPTFAIVNEYEIHNSNEKIYHFDLYRIKNINELLQIGFEDYIYSGFYCFIEWPDIAKQLLPNDYVNLKIVEDIHNHARMFEF